MAAPKNIAEQRPTYLHNRPKRLKHLRRSHPQCRFGCLRQLLLASRAPKGPLTEWETEKCSRCSGARERAHFDRLLARARAPPTRTFAHVSPGLRAHRPRRATAPTARRRHLHDPQAAPSKSDPRRHVPNTPNQTKGHFQRARALRPCALSVRGLHPTTCCGGSRCGAKCSAATTCRNELCRARLPHIARRSKPLDLCCRPPLGPLRRRLRRRRRRRKRRGPQKARMAKRRSTSPCRRGPRNLRGRSQPGPAARCGAPPGGSLTRLVPKYAAKGARTAPKRGANVAGWDGRPTLPDVRVLTKLRFGQVG